MTPPVDPTLNWVITRSAALGVLVVVGFGVLGDVGSVVGASLGVTLAMGNFWLMRRLVWRMLNGGGSSKGGAALAMMFKLSVFAGLIFLAMRYLPINLLALLGGLSVVVVVIMASAIFGPTPEPVDEAAQGGLEAE